MVSIHFQLFSLHQINPLTKFHPHLRVLNVGNGWEWRLPGWFLSVIMDHSRKFPAFRTSPKNTQKNVTAIPFPTLFTTSDKSPSPKFPPKKKQRPSPRAAQTSDHLRPTNSNVPGFASAWPRRASLNVPPGAAAARSPLWRGGGQAP